MSLVPVLVLGSVKLCMVERPNMIALGCHVSLRVQFAVCVVCVPYPGVP